MTTTTIYIYFDINNCLWKADNTGCGHCAGKVRWSVVDKREPITEQIHQQLCQYWLARYVTGLRALFADKLMFFQQLGVVHGRYVLQREAGVPVDSRDYSWVVVQWLRHRNRVQPRDRVPVKHYDMSRL